MSKNKTTIAITLFLMATMAVSLFSASPVYAISVIMNPETDLVEIHESIDIDLNGPSDKLYNLSLAVIYPGRTDWTIAGIYDTTSSGDLDVYDFDFNETGDYQIKWICPPQEGVTPNPGDPDGLWHSNVEIITCVLDRPQREFITYTYVAVSPQVIGINQPVVIVFWSNLIPPTARGDYGDRYYFDVYITDPEGNEEKLSAIKSDPVGGGWVSYTPTKIGKYTVVADNPGIDELTGEPGNIYDSDVGEKVLGAISPPTYFTVQEEQIPLYAETPLPTDYWTRPIHGTNRDWYQVASNWLGSYAQRNGSSTSYGFGEGPESSHVLWSRSLWSGGIMDYNFGDISFETSHYEGIDYSPVIINGVLYYNGGANPRQGVYAIDLYTGELKWYRDTTGEWPDRTDEVEEGGGGFDNYGELSGERIAYGQILDIENPNQHGGFAYFWATDVPGKRNTWRLYDAFTGNMICDLENEHSDGTMFQDDIGSLCWINFANLGTRSNPNYYMQVWNTTEAIWFRPRYGSHPPRSPTWEATEGATNTYWMWRPYPNATFDGDRGYSMNVSVPTHTGGSIEAVRFTDEDKYVIVGSAGKNDNTGVVQGFLRAYSLERPNWGDVLWETTFTPPVSETEDVTRTYEGGTQGINVDPESGVFFFWEPTTLKLFCYSIDTGKQIWEWKFEEQFAYYELRSSEGGFLYNGKYYSYGYTGMMHAIDVKTGLELWNWTAPDEGLGETWYPWTPLERGVIADGKVYLYTSEHSPTQPLRRDAHTWCVDLETGEMNWKLAAWGSGYRLADGRLTYFDHFDNQIYCIGKGPSATTVSAPQLVPAVGSSVVITGTVTDQSPSGRHNVAGSLDFSLKDTPAISDENMEEWMEYMFMQHAKPEDAKGVEVVLETVDPNGNFYEIGRTTSDINGNYGFKFTPEVPGDYQIIARFEGSASYGSSSDTTYLSVDEVPLASSTPPPPSEPSMADIYIVPGIVGIIIAIVAVGLVLVLMLRRR